MVIRGVVCDDHDPSPGAAAGGAELLEELQEADDVLMDAAKRYRVDTEKLQKAVSAELAAKRDKKTIKAKARKTAA